MRRRRGGPLAGIGSAVVAVLVLSSCSDRPGGGPDVGPPTTRSSSTPSSTPSSSDGGAPAAAASGRWTPKHVVVVVEENRSYADVVKASGARFLHSMGRHGATVTRMHAIRHPSQPNYVALFSGSTHRLKDDSCPHRFAGRNLGSQLRATGRTFAGYSQSLPRTGYAGCTHGAYARKHAPWVDFTNLPKSVNRPFSAFPRNYAKLPTVSFVIPNLDNDMHDGSIARADRWLQHNLSSYLTWARRHDSLLAVTWDEDDRSASNHIPTYVAGSHVRTGRYTRSVDLYSLLRTLQHLYRLKPLGASAHRSPMTGLFTR